MSATFSITASASKDIEEIADYLAQQSDFERAESFLEKLNDQLLRITNFPNIGRQRDDISEGVRSLRIESYLILYIPVGRNVEILRVVGGSRNLRTLFDD